MQALPKSEIELVSEVLRYVLASLARVKALSQERVEARGDPRGRAGQECREQLVEIILKYVLAHHL